MQSRVALPVWLIAGYYSMTDRIFKNFDSGQRLSHWALVLQRYSSEPIGIESNGWKRTIVLLSYLHD